MLNDVINSARSNFLYYLLHKINVVAFCLMLSMKVVIPKGWIRYIVVEFTPYTQMYGAYSYMLTFTL